VKTTKENAKNKDNVMNWTIYCATQIHEINKMMIRHLWLSPQDKNQC